MTFIDGDQVSFHSTSDSELDTLTGTISGVVSEHPGSTIYIVLLDKMHSKWPWRAIAMTEHCLEGI